MGSIIVKIYTLTIAVVVAIFFATTLYHISSSVVFSSYFGNTLSFATGEIFKMGGFTSYVTAFFAQKSWLVILYFSLASAIISASFAYSSSWRSESMVISLVALGVLFSQYSDTRFALLLTSSMFISVASLLFSYLYGRSRAAAIALLPILVACVAASSIWDKTTYLFVAITILNLVASRFVFPRYRERMITSCIPFLIGLVVSSIKLYSDYNPSLAHVMKMEQAAINENWSGVLELSKQAKQPNSLTCFYTNLSLLKSGVLSKYLFQFPQSSGSEGLNLSLDFQRTNDKLYDAVGVPNQALRCTFENYMVYGKNNYNLRELIYYYRKCGKENIAAKFSAMLPNYKPAKPSGYVTTAIDSTVASNHGLLQVLETVVGSDSKNRSAYEVLMAYYALDGRVAKFAELYGCAANFFKDGIPIYFKQVLVMYEDIMKKSGKPYTEFDIDSDVREQYAKFQSTKLHRTFVGSYWYYIYHIKPAKGKIYID